MNIRIQVLANQARRAIQQVEGDITRMAASNAAASVRGGRANDTLARSFQRMGSQVQWAGRQIAYNFSLPLAAAAAAGAKFALDNERAFTRVAKVYGDGSLAMETVNNELEALKKNFTALSEVYGVNRVEVTNIAADWAAAGASGAALARSVELTMKTMVLGEMDAAEATRALIAVQSQYGFSTEQLTDTIGQLNIVENQTGTSMQDLVDSMSRSAGVARAAGIDVRHLAAMTAALVPAAGTASQAGNALKTIISRLLSPTQEAAQILNEMGIATDSMAWASADGAARVKILSEQYEGLSDAQKAVASAALGGRQQLNKFEVLLEAVANDGSEAGTAMSYYYKALEATSDRTAYMLQLQKELDTVLASNPKKWDTVKVMMQNALADAIAPLLPYLIGMAREVANLAKKWGELDPSVQKAIGAIALLLIVIGPAMSLVGAFMTLVGYAATPFKLFGSAIMGLGGTLGLFSRTTGSALDGTEKHHRGFFSRIKGLFTAFFGWMSASLRAFGTLLMTNWRAIMSGILKVVTLYGRMLKVAWTLLWAGMAAAQKAATFILPILWGAVQAGMLALTTRFSSTIKAAWAATWAGVRAAQAAVTGVLVPLWAAVQAAMVTMTAAFRFALQAPYLAAWLGMRAIQLAVTSVFGPMWAAVQAAMVGITSAFRFVMTAPWLAMWLGMRAIQIAVSGVFGPLWAAVQTAMVATTAAFRFAMQAPWLAAWIGMLAIQRAAGAVFGPLWAAVQRAMLLLTTTFGPILQTAWAAMMTGLAAIQRAAGFVLTGLWGATLLGLKGLTMVGTKAIVLIWAGMTKAIPMLYGAMTTVLAAIGPAILAAISSPWTLAALAVIGIVYLLRDKIAEVWNNIVAYFQDANNGIVKAFNNLPRGVSNALIAVVTVVRDAALQVYEWFSYLNPFAHHSPSLVENVTRGMAIVRSEYGKIVDIKGPIDSAYASIKKFKEASRGLMDGMDSINRAKDRKSMVEAGVSDAVLGSFDELVGKLTDMKRRADQLGDAVTNQENAVTIWKDRLDAANDALDVQKDRLDAAQNVADSYKDSIDALRDQITSLASAPLEGIGAMEDALFDNEMAQNRLRLAMLKTAADGGMSFDDLRSKIASINGAIEGLSGEKAGLRSMGAGGEILGFYDEQINALQEQKKALNAAGAPIEKMQTELEKLQQQAEIMDLEKSLKFDPLTRAIDKAANGMKELPFSQVMTGITTNQAALVGLEANYARATAAVASQQAAVDQAQAASNAIQAAYDTENQKLDALKQVYDAATTSVRDMEAALTDAASAARLLTESGSSEYVTPGLQNFRDAEGGDFPDVGGGFNVGREGGLEDQSALIDDMTTGLTDELANAFDGFDMWAPFKDMWTGFVSWWDANVGPWVTGIGDFFSTAFSGVDLGGTIGGWFGGAFDGIDWAGIWTKVWETITSTVSNIWDIGSLIVDLFGEDFQATIDDIVLFFSELWRVLQTMWADIKERIDPFLEALGNLWTIIQVIAAVVIGGLVMGFQTLWSILEGVLGPAIHMIVGIFENLWDIVKGVIDVFIGLFTLDFGKVLSGLGEIFGGIVGILWDVIVGIGSMIWGAIQGLATGVWDNMKWLASMLWEGFKSGVDTAWDAVYGFFEGIIGGIIDWVKDLFGIASPSTIFAEIGEFLLEGLIEGLQGMMDAVTGFFSDLWDGIAGVIDWCYKNIIKPIWDAMVAAWDHIVQSFVNAYNNWLKPMWDALGDAMDWLWANLLKPIWDAMGTAWDNLLRGFKTIWEQVLKPVWTAIETAMDWLWKTILKPIWDAMKAGWEALGTGMKWVWDNVLKPMFDTFSTIVGGLRSVFDTVVGAIGTAWDGIKEKARTPINFVIETVLNNGLIKAFNAVVGFFGLDSWKIANLSPIALARGGQVPGYSPTDRADNIPARLTAGEFVQPVKAVDRYGKGFMESVRNGSFPMEAARQYAGGGYVDLFNALKEQGGFSRARMNDGFRPGANDMHGRGKAVDLGENGFAGGNGRPYLAAMNQWIYDNKGALTTELIYDGLGDNRADLKRGAPLNYGYALQQQHKNHVHLGVENIPAWINSGTGAAYVGATASADAAVRDNPSWWSDPIKYIRDAAENLMGGVPAGGKVADWAKKTPGRLVDNTKDWLIDKINPLGWLNGSTNLSGREIDMGPATGDIRSIVQGVAAQRGWGDGGQWSALSSLVNKESSWNPRAQNPSSTAYGLFQFLNGTWAGTGYAKTSDPRIQSQAGMQYIANRYGTPLEAWRFHQRNNHYDTGGILETGTTGTNLSGRPERVLSPRQTIAFERMVDILDSGSLLSAVARDRGAEKMQAQTIVYGNISGDTTTTYNFYGDLEFPEIKDGDDAEVFIRNLRDLSGSR